MKSSIIYYGIIPLGGSKMNDYIINFLKEIMAIDSPSGYTKEVIHHCQKEAENLGFHTHQTNKGNLEIYVEGQDEEKLIQVLKTELRLIEPGKVEKY